MLKRLATECTTYHVHQPLMGGRAAAGLKRLCRGRERVAPMRHAAGEGPTAAERADSRVAMAKMALQREPSFAMRMCADELEICDEPMTRDTLLALAPGSGEQEKEEL